MIILNMGTDLKRNAHNYKNGTIIVTLEIEFNIEFDDIVITEMKNYILIKEIISQKI